MCINIACSDYICLVFTEFGFLWQGLEGGGQWKGESIHSLGMKRNVHIKAEG